MRIPKHTKAWYCYILNIGPETLTKWIKPFVKELEATGYTKHQRLFSPKQRSIINTRLDITEEEYNKAQKTG